MYNIFITKVYAFKLGADIPLSGCKGDIEPGAYINCIYRFATWLAIGLAILMFIWGGYKYITSQGNPDSIEEAKTIISGAVIGLVLLILARLILMAIGGNLVS